MATDPPRHGEGDRAQHGGGGPPDVLAQPIKQVKRARRLRSEMSLPEVLLWQELRKRPGGFKFRRQFPQAPYTLDFACLASRTAIEIDGSSHDRGDAPRRDLQRDRFLMQRGFRVLRIPAREVLSDLESCVKAIVEACRDAGPPPPSAGADGPPPRAGEEL
ncbi:endonuclease domain-containing protein [Tsuneonella dongtanensis]|uniref:endonuclease domain-containing protein n=1 Tax=Tsuneonella dongtanensis TaxID=692370 RepID=UPI0012EECD31|nr:endonuclease domain-containing protein [Tsuneonella dongtanensis]